MSFARLNLLAMLAMPVCATLAALIVFGVLGETLLTVFGMNLLPMLLAGAVSGLLLLLARRGGDAARRIALAPSVVPAVLGSVWYLGRALVPNPVAPGVEYIAAPQYLLLWVLGLSVVAFAGVLVARRLARG